MAYIRERTNRHGELVFQANIRLRGFSHKAKMFKYREDAERWSRETEASMVDGGRGERLQMPPRGGCYVVFDGKRCLYVGSSRSNILKRVSEWCGMATHYIVVSCEPMELLATEYRLIEQYRPDRNKLGVAD